MSDYTRILNLDGDVDDYDEEPVEEIIDEESDSSIQNPCHFDGSRHNLTGRDLEFKERMCAVGMMVAIERLESIWLCKPGAVELAKQVRFGRNTGIGACLQRSY